MYCLNIHLTVPLLLCITARFLQPSQELPNELVVRFKAQAVLVVQKRYFGNRCDHVFGYM